MALAAALGDLVLPATCAGCETAHVPLRYGACAACADELEALVPSPARPHPTPPGMPACTATGGYDGVLRAALLSYKERGRHVLARPLGVLLAAAAASAVPDGPLLLVPVPSTARAARARHGDHMARLAGHARRRLRVGGRLVRVVPALRARPRVDSAALDRAGRALAAEASFVIRRNRVRDLAAAARGATVVVVDDVVTSGATLAAVARRLGEVGVPVDVAAVLAATRRRCPPGSTD